jgi:hypothetical protein
VPLEEPRSHRNRSERDGGAGVVAGIAYRSAARPLLEHGHEPQIDLFRARRIRAHTVEQRIPRLPIGQEREGAADLVLARHPRRHQQRLARREHVLDEGEVRHVRRADLVRRDVERLEKVDAASVPRRAEERGAPVRAVATKLAKLVVGELEFDEQRNDVLKPLLTVSRLLDDRVLISLAQAPLLELHGVSTGLDRRVYELLGDAEIAVVVETDLGDDVHRLLRADAPIGDTQYAFLDRHVAEACEGAAPTGLSAGLESHAKVRVSASSSVM